MRRGSLFVLSFIAIRFSMNRVGALAVISLT